MAGTTGLEPATSAVTGQRSNQLSYVPKIVFNNLVIRHIEQANTSSKRSFLLYHLVVLDSRLVQSGPVNPTTTPFKFSRTSPKGVDRGFVAKHFSSQQTITAALQ
jgi:hypothetical protein